MRRYLTLAGALIPVLVVLMNAKASAEGSSFEKRCHDEVIVLHEVIEAWLAGTVPNTDEAYSRFSEAMARDFEIISPTGTRSDRDAIVSSLRGAHGARQASFSIEVRNIRTRLLTPPLALLTYEEWQFAEGKTTARLSSVLLRDDPSKPDGVAWVHLQETWLPGLSPDSGRSDSSSSD